MHIPHTLVPSHSMFAVRTAGTMALLRCYISFLQVPLAELTTANAEKQYSLRAVYSCSVLQPLQLLQLFCWALTAQRLTRCSPRGWPGLQLLLPLHLQCTEAAAQWCHQCPG
jgi:hypothetical protein